MHRMKFNFKSLALTLVVSTRNHNSYSDMNMKKIMFCLSVYESEKFITVSVETSFGC